MGIDGVMVWYGLIGYLRIERHWCTVRQVQVEATVPYHDRRDQVDMNCQFAMPHRNRRSEATL
jgi:hypothetical protein